jgi:hypothetical protein
MTAASHFDHVLAGMAAASRLLDVSRGRALSAARFKQELSAAPVDREIIREFRHF